MQFRIQSPVHKQLLLSTAALAVFALLAPSTAFAGTSTTSMSVSSTVSANCTISSPAALAFGSYDPVVANATANLDVSPNALSVACTKGATATIGLDLGANFTGTTRRMKDSGGTNFLTYEIYTATGRTTVWNSTNTVSYTSAGKASTTLPVFGRIVAGQDVAATAYTDSITATVNF